jgi:hypothetical protein
MSNAGRIMWVPRIIIEQIEDLKENKIVKKNSEAFKKIAENARVGFEAEHIIHLDFAPRRRKGGIF